MTNPTRRLTSTYANVLDTISTINRTGASTNLTPNRLNSHNPNRVITRIMVVITSIILITLGQSYALANVPNAHEQEIWKLYAHTRLLDTSQFECLNTLWNMESHWNNYAKNDHSTAYGIAQMLSVTTSDPYKQIDLGLTYIRNRYNSPCTALQYHYRHGHY